MRFDVDECISRRSIHGASPAYEQVSLGALLKHHPASSIELDSHSETSH